MGPLKLEWRVWGGDPIPMPAWNRLLFAKRQKGIFNLRVGRANTQGTSVILSPDHLIFYVARVILSYMSHCLLSCFRDECLTFSKIAGLTRFCECVHPTPILSAQATPNICFDLNVYGFDLMTME